MEKQQKATGQQDTNAALAALAAAGNSFALGQLWEINKGLLHRWFWQWYSKNKAVADSAGLTIEDFDQEAFFAVQAAAKAYDPEKGSFATLLGYYVQNRIRKVVCGEHGRLMTTEDGREVRISANPLNGSTSLDTPLDDTDGGSATLGDLQEDPAAAQAVQAAEEEIYTQELHAALEEALNKLTAKQADVVRRHYFGGECLSEIAREDNTTRSAPYNHEQAAFLALRRNPALARWHDDILSAKAWRGTGFGAWKHSGSVQERTVEYLEKKGAEHFDYYAWRNQMIREHYAAFEADGYFDRHPEQRPEPPNG